MPHGLTACLLLMCLSGRLTAAVGSGDGLGDVVQRLGEPRASIPLPDDVQLLAFDQGNVWVRNGRVIGTDLLSSQALAERRQTDAARREQAARRELEQAARERDREQAAEAQARQQDALVEQVRREVRFPTYPTSAFGGYLSENDIREPPPGVVSVDFARPIDHDRDPGGTINRVRLYVSNRQSSGLPDCRLVLTFIGRAGDVLAVAHAPVPRLPSGGVVLVEAPRPTDSTAKPAPWIGDGRRIHEVRVDLYDVGRTKVFLANTRWFRPDVPSPAGASR